MVPFTTTERYELLDRLEANGLFFNTLWCLSEIYFTDQVKTAAVTFNNTTSMIKMLFNKTFWESLPDNGQLFVVCHEQLHLMLDHFDRLDFAAGDVEDKNRAADVGINHMLIRNYFFEKTDLPNWERYCWVDTVFPDQVVSDNETAEYYYALIKQKRDKNEDVNGESLDDHQFTESNEASPGDGTPSSVLTNQDIKKAIKEAVDQVKKDLAGDRDEVEAREYIKSQCKDFTAGTGTTDHEQLHTVKRKANNSWKSLYMQIPKRIAKTKMTSHWVMTERRNALVATSLKLPGALELDVKDRVRVHVYLDTSGSCIYDAKYFLQSAMTMSRKMFDVKLFGFDQAVYDIPDKPPYKLTGFGGTSFQALVDHVNTQSYTVDAAMVFTDGEAPTANPKYPKRWHYFITPDGTDQYIGSSGSVYWLADYGWKQG